MASLNLAQRALLWAIPVVFAVSVHELAHGLCALWFGDGTARRSGRLSLNPLTHVDPLGSVVVPAAFLLLGGFVFGWARPVPVTVENLRHPRRDMVFVAAAGPLANLLMALLWAMLMKLGLWVAPAQPLTAAVLVYLGAAGVFINTAILMLNLLPIPPLDGGRMLAGLLPGRPGRWLAGLEPWGFPILLVIILAGMAGKLVWPMMVVGMAAVTWLTAVPVDLLTNALWVLLGGAA
jgi:Zn-dependent protease